MATRIECAHDDGEAAFTVNVSRLAYPATTKTTAYCGSCYVKFLRAMEKTQWFLDLEERDLLDNLSTVGTTNYLK